MIPQAKNLSGKNLSKKIPPEKILSMYSAFRRIQPGRREVNETRAGEGTCWRTQADWREGHRRQAVSARFKGHTTKKTCYNCIHEKFANLNNTVRIGHFGSERNRASIR